VYSLTGHNGDDVTGVTSEEYFKDKDAAPRPAHSVLDLSKLRATGFTAPSGRVRLEDYLGQEVPTP
jgi:dTDP-4-dehydrorhamnose 3,5-epimerase